MLAKTNPAISSPVTGLLMIHMKEIDEAIRLFTEVIKLEPDNEATKKQLTELYKYKQQTATSPPVNQPNQQTDS